MVMKNFHRNLATGCDCLPFFLEKSVNTVLSPRRKHGGYFTRSQPWLPRIRNISPLPFQEVGAGQRKEQTIVGDNTG